MNSPIEVGAGFISAKFFLPQLLAWHGMARHRKELLNRDWFSTSFGGVECQRSSDHHDQIVQRYQQASSIQFVWINN